MRLDHDLRKHTWALIIIFRVQHDAFCHEYENTRGNKPKYKEKSAEVVPLSIC